MGRLRESQQICRRLSKNVWLYAGTIPKKCLSSGCIGRLRGVTVQWQHLLYWICAHIKHRSKEDFSCINKAFGRNLTQLPYLNLYTNLVNSAMELDVFSRLTEPTTTGTLAGKMDWNPSNTGYLLSALTSIGFVEKNGEFYRNTSETDRYLVKGSPEYLGGFLLFYGLNEGATPMDVKKLVTNGPQPVSQPQMDQSLDFAQYGAALRAAQAGYRQQELLRIVRALPENSGVRRVLDVGCATGLLGLAVVGDQLERTGVLFDQIPPNLIQESVEMAGLSHRIEVKTAIFSPTIWVRNTI